MPERNAEETPQQPTGLGPDSRVGRSRPAPVSKEDETTYSREDLMAGAAGFGVAPEAIAGAWRLADAPADGRMTRAQMEAAIKHFAERPVEE